MIVYWKSDKKELLNFINKAEQFISEVEKWQEKKREKNGKL
jgi:hypothetical protein